MDRVNLENDAYIERQYFNEIQGNGLKRYVEAPDSTRMKDFGIRGVEQSAVVVMVLAKSFRIRYALNSNIRGYYNVWSGRCLSTFRSNTCRSLLLA